MQVVGLTGSIAMGKSHAARMFKRFGVPVFDSDAAVHGLFGPGQSLPQRIAAEFGDVLDNFGGIDRQKLGCIVLGNPQALKSLEELVHPSVFETQRTFLQVAARQGFSRVVLDIPLLFEGGKRQRFDAVIVVACSPGLQRSRALARPGMTMAKLSAILAKQMPVYEKIKRADRVIHSGFDRGQTHQEVAQTLLWLDQRKAHAWPKAWA